MSKSHCALCIIGSPDVPLIRNERLAQNPPPSNPAPLSPAPELVVEVISPSNKPSVLNAKITDHQTVDVREVWVVRSKDRTVEVMRLSRDEIESVGVYGIGQVATSVIFDGLAIAIDDISAA